MLSEAVFKNCLAGLCKMNGVAIERDTFAMYYRKVKNDFTDNEFLEISNDILENENLYGKFPVPYLFYSRKKAKKDKTQKVEMISAMKSFQDKILELCYNDYNTDGAIKELYEHLTPSEERTLEALGGFSSVYSSCRKNGEYSDEKTDWTIRRLQEKFSENYNLFSDTAPKIEQEKDERMIKKIEDLTKGMFK